MSFTPTEVLIITILILGCLIFAMTQWTIHNINLEKEKVSTVITTHDVLTPNHTPCVLAVATLNNDASIVTLTCEFKKGE